MEYDASYKDFFSEPEMVESLLTGFVQEDFVRDLDFSTLRRCSGSYITDDLRERMDDCVWQVRWRGRSSYLCLILEFQSTPDPWMPVRIMTYTGLLWQDLAKSKQIKPGERLPPVLPVVIYNGSDEWKVCLSVEEMCEPVSLGLKQYSFGTRYYLVDEKHTGAAAAGSGNLFSYMVRFENSKTAQEARAVIADLIPRIADPRYSGLRRLFTVWLQRVVLKNARINESIPELHDLQEVDNMLAETVASWQENFKEEMRDEIEKEVRDEIEKEVRDEIEKEVRDEIEKEVSLKNLAANLRTIMDGLGWTRQKAMDFLKVSQEDREKLATGRYEPGADGTAQAAQG